MDCTEINRSEMHELFLLERLSSDELAAYQKHVATCSDCQKRQSYEINILAGIRAAGKSAMKEEIKQLAREEQAVVSNRRALTLKLAAAAFICVLAPTMLYIYKTSIKPLGKMPVLAEQFVEDDLDDSLDDSIVEDMPAPAPEPAKEKSALGGQASADYLELRDSKLHRTNPQRSLQKSKKQEAELGLSMVEEAPLQLEEAGNEILEAETEGRADRDKNMRKETVARKNINGDLDLPDDALDSKPAVEDDQGIQTLTFSDELKKKDGPAGAPKGNQPQPVTVPPGKVGSLASKMKSDTVSSKPQEAPYSTDSTSGRRARRPETQLMHWRYVLDARVVDIIRAVSEESGTGFPKTFDVQILHPSENTWQLICSFNETMNKIDQSTVDLAWLDEQTLKLTFKGQRISYLIKTDLARTKAVLEKAQ